MHLARRLAVLIANAYAHPLNDLAEADGLSGALYNRV